MMHDFLSEQLLQWGAPERVWWIPLFIAAIAAVWWRLIQLLSHVKALAQFPHISLMLHGFAVWRSAIKALCMSIGLVFVALALLQPQWGFKDMPVLQEGRDVLIALDVSGSMQAQDIKPSRLAFVKLKIRKLLEKLSFERVGLILFSGTAFVQCPLTADYATFLMFLDQVTTESISSGTTAIGSALTKGAELFNRSQNRKNKLLLLITDGEDFASNKKQLAQLIEKEKITVFAWGVGTTQGAPVPLYNERGIMTGHAKGKDGQIAMTALNEPLLTELSAAVGGVYQRVLQDDSDITALVSGLAAYEREKLEERNISHYQERYPFFLGVAWICFILEWIL